MQLRFGEATTRRVDVEYVLLDQVIYALSSVSVVVEFVEPRRPNAVVLCVVFGEA